MVITKTPYRISFFGGGTDFPIWFNKNGGSVLSTSIDKYCYISCRRLPKFFAHKHRFVYSQIENISDISEIKHPAIRGVLNWMEWSEGIEVHHDGDLPARSGLGSSSAFTVGLINALRALDGKLTSKLDLAKNAIFVEQKILEESVGCQDQVAVAFGGLNKIDFYSENRFSVNPVTLTNENSKNFENHLMLFFTGISRYSTEIIENQLKDYQNRQIELERMYRMVDEGLGMITSGAVDDFGLLLNEAWHYKKKLSSSISNQYIDEIYELAIRSGALGGKVLGAGGGGFILFYVKPDRQADVKMALSNLTYVPFKFDYSGATIALYQPQGL